MNSRAAAQALVPGRVIMLADKSSGLTELGVICGSVPAAKTGIQLGTSPAAGVPDVLSAWHPEAHGCAVQHQFGFCTEREAHVSSGCTPAREIERPTKHGIMVASYALLGHRDVAAPLVISARGATSLLRVAVCTDTGPLLCRADREAVLCDEPAQAHPGGHPGGGSCLAKCSCHRQWGPLWRLSSTCWFCPQRSALSHVLP